MAHVALQRPTPGLVPGVFVWLLLIGIGAASASDCRPQSSLEAVRVAKVVDGDTLRLHDGRRVRLIGINAPERAASGRPAEPFAAQAAAALDRRLGAGRQLWLQPGNEPADRYGRLLAHAFTAADGGSVEAALLRDGLALHVAVPPNVALADCLAAAEQTARAARKGLWRQSAAISARDLPPAEGGFRRVRGTVMRADESRHSWWLELDGPLVVRLDKRNLHYFDNIDPRGWRGRAVIVRGWLGVRGKRAGDDRKPLIMSLQHPTMIE